MNLHHLIEQKYNCASGELLNVLRAEHGCQLTEWSFGRKLKGDVLIWPDDARTIERAAKLEDGWLDRRRWKQVLDEDENMALSIIRSCREGAATTTSMIRLLDLIAHLTKPLDVLRLGPSREER